MKKCRFTVQEIIEAAKKSNGFYSQAAKILGVSCAQIKHYRDKYPKVEEVFQDYREKQKDFTESQLFKKIKEGDTACILFYLKCQAKDRGYYEKQKVEGALTFEGIINSLPEAWRESITKLLIETYSKRSN